MFGGCVDAFEILAADAGIQRQKKTPSAATSFWTRLLESRDEQPEAVSEMDDSAKEASKLKVQSKWTKGLTAAKVSSCTPGMTSATDSSVFSCLQSRKAFGY